MKENTPIFKKPAKVRKFMAFHRLCADWPLFFFEQVISCFFGEISGMLQKIFQNLQSDESHGILHR
jgi:hypothetical protein